MREKSWLDKYVPDELRMALGDLVIVAAGVESSAYGVARIYRVPEPQLHSAKRILGKLEARVGELGIPPWADVERNALLAWSHAARLLLQERDLLVHASISIGGERPDGKSDTFRWSLRDNSRVDSDAHHVERLVRLLIRVRHAGMDLEHGLLYPSANGGRIPPAYVTFGRVAVPTLEVPVAWSEWADRAAPEQAPKSSGASHHGFRNNRPV
jgi:hypothetical protein